MIALTHDVIENGVLPDLESPRDLIAIEDAPISQAPTTYPEGFTRRGREFRASLSHDNLEMSVRFYAPVFKIAPKRAEQFIALLRDVANTLGDDASPDEVFVFMRDLLAGTEDLPETPLATLTAAYHDFWDYQARGGYVFDTNA